MDNPHRDPMKNHFARQARETEEAEKHRSRHVVLIFGILAAVLTAVGIALFQYASR
jgi:hypothetical protein